MGLLGRSTADRPCINCDSGTFRCSWLLVGQRRIVDAIEIWSPSVSRSRIRVGKKHALHLLGNAHHGVWYESPRIRSRRGQLPLRVEPKPACPGTDTRAIISLDHMRWDRPILAVIGGFVDEFTDPQHVFMQSDERRRGFCLEYPLGNHTTGSNAFSQCLQRDSLDVAVTDPEIAESKRKAANMTGYPPTILMGECQAPNQLLRRTSRIQTWASSGSSWHIDTRSQPRPG